MKWTIWETLMYIRWFIRLAPLLPALVEDIKSLAAELSDDDPTEKQILDAIVGAEKILADIKRALT